MYIYVYTYIYSIIKTGVAESATSLSRCSVNTSQAGDMGSVKKPGETLHTNQMEVKRLRA